MINILTIIVLIVTTALLVVVFLRLQASASKQDIHDLAHSVQLGRAKLLVENVERIKSGDTKEKVERLLGKADSPIDQEWIYYLDDHSGYVIAFNSASRVETVKAWKS